MDSPDTKISSALNALENGGSSSTTQTGFSEGLVDSSVRSDDVEKISTTKKILPYIILIAFVGFLLLIIYPKLKKLFVKKDELKKISDEELAKGK